MASAMDIDDEEVDLPSSSSGKGEKKRFEVKKVKNIFLFNKDSWNKKIFNLNMSNLNYAMSCILILTFENVMESICFILKK